MKKVVLAAAIAAISSGALAQTSIPVTVSGLVVPAQEAPEVPEVEKNCTVRSDSGSINLAFNDVEQRSAATSESDALTVSDCSGATVSLSTTEDGPQSDTISGSITGREGTTDVEIPLEALVAGVGVNLFEQAADIESDSTEIEVTASLTAEQTSKEGAVSAQGTIYVTIDGQDTPAPAPEERANALLGELAGFQGQASDLAKELETATMPVLGDLEGADPQAAVEQGIADAAQNIPALEPGAGENPFEGANPQAFVEQTIGDAAQNIPALEPGAGENPFEGANPQAFVEQTIGDAAQNIPALEPGAGENPFEGANPQAIAEQAIGDAAQNIPALDPGAVENPFEGANPQAFVEQTIGDAAQNIPAVEPGAGENPFEGANPQAFVEQAIGDAAQNITTPPPSNGGEPLEQFEAALDRVAEEAATIEELADATATDLEDSGNNVMQQGEENQGNAESSIADFLTVEVSEEFDMGEVALETDFLDLSAGVITQR